MKQHREYQMPMTNHLSKEDTVRHMEVRDLSNKELSERIRKKMAEEKALQKTNTTLDGFKQGLRLSKEELFKTIMFNKIVKQ